MAKKIKVAKEKGKPKKWYPVTVPAMFKEQVIGEIPCKDISHLLNRTVSINLMSATRDFRHQDTTLTFTITSVSGQVAQAALCALRLSPSSLKRLVRRKTDRIDVRVPVKTKNDQDAIIKIVLITLNNTYHKVKSALIAATEKEALALIKKTGFVELAQQLTANKFQKDVKQALNKVFPVRYVIVKDFFLVSKSAIIEEQIAPVEDVSEVIAEPQEAVEEKPKKKAKMEETLEEEAPKKKAKKEEAQPEESEKPKKKVKEQPEKKELEETPKKKAKKEELPEESEA
jgi:ribosomal protein S3AE